MASHISILFLIFLCYFSQSYYAYAGKESSESSSHQSYYTIQVSSLLPSSVCESSTKVGNKKASTLQVVHKHGPCNKLKQDKSKAPTHAQILLQDQSRVNSIHSRLSKKLSPDRAEKAAVLPAKDGSTIGSGNYIVTVGLGTPEKELSLIFDTGSDLTWTQCEPCVRYCYDQKEPRFDPPRSKSYGNISCDSAACRQLTAATGDSPKCSASTCIYAIEYGDSSYSVGFFAKEKLTLTRYDIFKDFLFGCGQNNRGLFGGAAGLLGLGRSKISIIEQTSAKYKKFFSYCLPSSSSSTGHLTFGNEAVSTAVKYTPSAAVSESFYGLDIMAISVAGKKLSISAKVFSSAGAIIDSGTVITRLPPTAYEALRDSFRQSMKKYPKAPALSILDTCYDLSKSGTVLIPKIQFLFSGGVQVDLDAKGILYVNNTTQACLAFAPNGDDSDAAIYGNIQQLTFEVVYDVAGRRVGFGPKGCA